MAELTRDQKDAIAITALKMMDAGLKHKRVRFSNIKKSIDDYNGIVRPALRGRFNVPIPIMGGFVDTLQSKIDERIKINFNKTEAADYRKALKVQAAWDVEANDSNGKWNQKTLAGKKHAIFSGRAIHQYFASSTPEYKSNFLTISPWDFFCEPRGGGDLQQHYFRGKINIFRDKSELEDGAAKGIYDPIQVKRILMGSGQTEIKAAHADAKEKDDLMRALGLEPELQNYLGTDVYNLAEMEARINGMRVYILLDTISRQWVRIEPLKKLYSSDAWTYLSWATHYDDDNFWSKSPCDDMRPTAEGMQLGINQLFDAMNKRNWPQRLVDYKRIVDETQLDWRPFGVIEVNRTPGEPLDNFVKTFQDASDPSLPTVQINLIEFLKEFVSRETGVTPSAQGLGNEKQATILVSNLRQVSDRLGLYNNHYRQFLTEAGGLYLLGMRDNMPNELLVQIIGENGVEEDYLTKNDVNAKFDINITGGNAEEQQNELKLSRKSQALAEIVRRPDVYRVNQKWITRERLSIAGYDDAVIQIAVDVESQGNEDIIARAAQAIQDIIAKKPLRRYMNANRMFLGYIYNFAANRDLTDDLHRRLVAYADLHIPIAMENEMMRAQHDFALNQRMQSAGAEAGVPGTPPTPGGQTGTGMPAAVPADINEAPLRTPILNNAPQ